ncbi:MAG: hypothetical protein GXY77_09445 [Fibrobacter sp.]|nr:hypothetical protein [Fibrobacter sp.]
MKKPRILIIILFIFTNVLYAEEFDLNVYASKFDSIPIGIIDFSSTGTRLKKDQPHEIIAQDLDFCGRFNVVTVSQYDSAVFADASAGIYVDGEYTVEGSETVINCYLRDVASQELIIGKKYKGEQNVVRAMMHRYCNELVEMLFGDRGIFESKILYVKSSNGKRDIAIMDFDGYNHRQITKNNVVNIFPAFVTKNSMIWTSYERGKPDLYIGSVADGSSKLFIYSKAVESSPAVSPVDGTVAYASSRNGNMDVYICNSDKTNVRQLTVHYGVDTSPAWSPNGYQIAFTSDRSGNPQIYVMDSDGANQHRVTFEHKYADSPSWSPKGDKIAYMAMGENGKFDIWTIAPDGTNPQKVTSISGHNEYPKWAPDGSLIAFVNATGSYSDLYVVKADGSRVRRVTKRGDVKMPDWSGF